MVLVNEKTLACYPRQSLHHRRLVRLAVTWPRIMPRRCRRLHYAHYACCTSSYSRVGENRRKFERAREVQRNTSAAVLPVGATRVCSSRPALFRSLLTLAFPSLLCYDTTTTRRSVNICPRADTHQALFDSFRTEKILRTTFRTRETSQRNNWYVDEMFFICVWLFFSDFICTLESRMWLFDYPEDRFSRLL